MRKKFLLSLITSVTLVCLTPDSVFAFGCPIIDLKNMTKVFQNVFNLQDNVTIASASSSKEEQLNEIKNGNPGCSSNPSNTQTEIKTTAWDYINKGKIRTTIVQEKDGEETKTSYDERVIDLISKSNYLSAPKGMVKISDAKKELIKAMFFESKEAHDNASANDKEELRTKRKRYASEVASRGYALANALRPRLKKDSESLLNAQTSGCNQTQSHALQNRNLKALIKTTAANIAVQIITMETEAALQLINEPLLEMSPEDVGGKK